MSLKTKRPSTSSESLLSRKSLLSPDFQNAVTYLDKMKSDSVKSAKLVLSYSQPNPRDVVQIPPYDGYVESRYVEIGYVENTN